MQFTKYTKKIFLICFFFSLSFGFLVHVEAASLSMSSVQTQISVGQTARYRILLNTQSVAANAVEGVISFDPTMVEVVSISSMNSVLNIWIEEPRFSNSAGTISFGGGVTPPGFIGSTGEIFSVTFKAKKEGTTGFKIRDVSVRQNDGSGTEIYSGIGPNTNASTLIIQNSTIDSSVDKPVNSPVTEAPKKDKPIPSKLSMVVNDGLVEIVTVDGNSIDYAEIFVGTASSTKVIALNKKITYLLPKLEPGLYEIKAIVFDKVGNSVLIKDTINIPISYSISISKLSDTHVIGDLISIQGQSTVQDSLVTVSIVSPNQNIQSYQVKTNSEGEFEFSVIAEQEGMYSVSAEIPQIIRSEILYFSVEITSLQKTVRWINGHLPILRGVVLVLILALLASIYIQRRKLYRTHYVTDMEKLEISSDKTLEMLKHEVKHHLVNMDKIARFRDLTESEKVLYMHCRSILK